MSEQLAGGGVRVGRALVVTASNRAAAGVYADSSLVPGIAVLREILPHAVAQVRGGDHPAGGAPSRGRARM
jgi:hypothetical protein